jgi:hypothetical protein
MRDMIDLAAGDTSVGFYPFVEVAEEFNRDVAAFMQRVHR